MKRNIVAGLDIGTTKVCCVIAEKSEDGLVVKGIGDVKSNGGMRNGLITNIKIMSDAVKTTVEKASENLDVKVNELNIGIAGEHIQSIHYRGMVPISGENNEVIKEDIDRLNDDVRKINSSKDRQILHIIPEKFWVDDNLIDNPLGFVGQKLVATHNIIMASAQAVANIERAVALAGYSVRSKVLQPIASSMSVLNNDEKDLGIILIDIGGGTTDIVVFHDKIYKFSAVVGLGGNKITEAISTTFSIVKEQAERVKIQMGYAHPSAIVKKTSIVVPGVGAKGDVEINTEMLTQIIYTIMKKTFEFIDGKLRKEKLKRDARAGIVITGGGAMLRGITELAEEVFGMPAKLGLPHNVSVDREKIHNEILKPEYATALGLIQDIPGITSEQLENTVIQKPKKSSKFSVFMDKVKEIFNEL